MSTPNQNVMWLITHKALEKQKAKYEAELALVNIELRQAKAFIDALYDRQLNSQYYFCGMCEYWYHQDECFTTDIDGIEFFEEVWSDYNPFGDCVCDDCYYDHNGVEVCMVCDGCDEMKQSNIMKNYTFTNSSNVTKYDKLCIDCYDECMKEKWEELFYGDGVRYWKTYWDIFPNPNWSNPMNQINWVLKVNGNA